MPISYAKNTETGRIVLGNLPAQYRKTPWIPATQSEIDSYELDNSKIAKINKVTTDRKDFIYSPIEYNGTTFINSEISGNNLQAAYQFSEEPIEWLDIEGNSITLTKLQLGELIGLIMSKRSSGYFQEATLIKAIEACSTMDELEAIVIEFV